jgi:hypothetical protein
MIPSTRIQKSSSDSKFFKLQNENPISGRQRHISFYVILIMDSLNALHKEKPRTFQERDKTHRITQLPTENE